MSQPLSHSDLLRIIEEYLTSDLTKYATEKKYGLYQGCITYWLRTFGLDDKPKNEDIMVEQPTTSTPETPLSPSEKDELQTLRREIRELNTHSCTITAPYSSPAALASSARMSSDFWPISIHSTTSSAWISSPMRAT